MKNKEKYMQKFLAETKIGGN